MSDRVTTYAILTSAMQEAAEDNSTEFQEYLPVAINNAELRLTRELDTLGLTAITTVAATVSVAEVTKPSGYLLAHSIVYVDPTTSRRTVLRKKTDDYLDTYWPQPTSVGSPIYYSELDNTTIKIAPCVSVSANLIFNYEKRPTPLSVSNQTNYFTDFCADALFHASMMEMAMWMRNQALMENHQALYTSDRDSINNQGRRARRDDGSPVGNTVPAVNTLGTAGNQ